MGEAASSDLRSRTDARERDHVSFVGSTGFDFAAGLWNSSIMYRLQMQEHAALM